VTPQQLQIEDDPVLREAAIATLFELPQTRWRLVRMTPAHEGFSGANYIFTQTLVSVGGALALGLVLAYAVLRLLVILPLKRMTHDLAYSGAVEDSLHVALDESPRNELGMLAHWINERGRQVRELMDRSSAADSQLMRETDERRTAQDQLARLRERSESTLQALADGVIYVDESGRIEDLNPAATALTGLAAETARGRRFGDVVHLRVEAGMLPNIAEDVIRHGERIDWREGAFLLREPAADREIELSAIPLRTRLKRVSGAVFVLRLRNAAAPAAADAHIDALTGLPTRAAYDRQLRRLLEASRATTRTHALLLVEPDELKKIIDAGGRDAGNDALAQLAHAIEASAGNAASTFRIGARQFGLLLQDADLSHARAFAEGLRTKLAAAQTADGARCCTASIGGVVFDTEAGNPAEVMRRAEEACNAAKRAGRNSVKVYDDSMSRFRPAVDDGVWVRRIRAGIEVAKKS